MQYLGFFGIDGPTSLLMLETVLDAIQHISDQVSVINAKELGQLSRAPASKLEVGDVWLGEDGSVL